MGLAARQTWSARWIVSLISLVTLVLTCLRYYYQESQAAWNYTGIINEQRIHEQQGALKEHQSQESIQDIMNATLGFNKVLAINIPSRTDKRDQLVLGSSLTGFVIDFIDGVDAKGINPKTYPYNWNQEHSATEYACLRAHLNAAQRIVQEGLRTALILEDDVDWDVSIKPQLQTFAHAVRTLQNTVYAPTESPYGDEWDILWLGHCGASCKTEEPFYMIPNDPTLPKPTHLPTYYHGPPENVRPDSTRLVCTLQDAACTPAYAMSYRGAQRILAALSVNPSGFADKLQTGDQIDLELGRMCKSGLLKCFAPYPALTGTYRSAGLSSKGTDQSEHNRAAQMEPAISWGLVYSTMLNIKHILQGERVVHSTWPDVDNPAINPEDIHFESGYIYTYRPEHDLNPIPMTEKEVVDEFVFADEASFTDEP
ncbi:hypothetical protein PEBR_03211 [Penicillium brasilianum]|uniref:Glycosyl transferase family 25 domain-containing protein n=1 Tax=Penicillium brasilianum TaxID=104259 RepID=A0A1S9RYR6_PENBI|nr:hypothetical protein PEBR_03211 [Penicillium brasilianum]